MLSTSVAVRPQLQQTVNPHLIVVGALLELSNAELERMVREELERNPALETDLAEDHLQAHSGDQGAPWETDAAERLIPTRPRGLAALAPESPDRMHHLPAGTTLRDHLRWQLRAAAPEALVGIGEYLIENINADGYLDCDLAEACDALGATPEQVKEALAVLQDLDPPGVAARSLQECLLLQHRHLDAGVRRPERLQDVIIASTSGRPARLAEIARRAGVSLAQAQECLEFIRSHFAPYPGRSVRTAWGESMGEKQASVLPDAIITLDGDQVLVRVPESESLRLRINGAYRRLHEALETHNAYVRKGRNSPELLRARAQAAECVRRARTLIQQIQQRNRTLWQVTTAIASRQEAFLRHGPDHLLPLTKKEIAHALGIHESIVCRATRGKSVMLPSGEVAGFEVFFDDALPIKRLVHGLIAGENPGQPLSDADITRSLAANGIEIARRTVTKYRRALRIPPSRERACMAAMEMAG
jgi:RNA polymerase sigma-54 factor